MEANFGGECSLSVSLSLSLCVSRLSLSRSRVQREKQTNNSNNNNNNNGNNTKRERVTTKEFVFSDVCLFSSFSFEIPQKETRAALCISSSPFCLVSALLLLFLLLKKSAFLRRILLCARVCCILLSKVQETSAKAHKRLLGDWITWPTFLCESTRNRTTRVRLQ